MLGREERKMLVETARRSIIGYYRNGRVSIETRGTPKELLKKRASFVTITLNGKLRGCIGTIKAFRPLIRDVAENAVGAAFFDPRFKPMDIKEIMNCTIHISVLSEMERIHAKTGKDVLESVEKGVHGVFLKKGWAQATYLPSVWREIPKKEDFLDLLCEKAGLPIGCWRYPNDVEIYRYTVEEFGE